MGWAILWGFIIGGFASYDSGGSPETAGFIAFLVIWYFAHERTRLRKVMEQRMNPPL